MQAEFKLNRFSRTCASVCLWHHSENCFGYRSYKPSSMVPLRYTIPGFKECCTKLAVSNKLRRYFHTLFSGNFLVPVLQHAVEGTLFD
ncbi:hypothetical protein DM02DRAFT_407502 [Periconia macrospinosa]|uniref:Uncharacterized protein n=1 Tax=Periconia macrospinosa TaxID=97972 RepID=A0A2V1E855_9PLEO|nr:hypothetical protein DM02DRAFT_407502 [Periconia macrospinosa]